VHFFRLHFFKPTLIQLAEIVKASEKKRILKKWFTNKKRISYKKLENRSKKSWTLFKKKKRKKLDL